ncbi:DUF2268 domain-containing putative Zn-dependent protease [Candidatus Nanohalovita haloferacivicina]|uniref:DUF2268 domain-containing putative Zn-dependent protease n=1 Tax=Candidatus Nanohalovita haloferacivicina TaxID=2978046 RepID=UPI00325FA5B4|nr:hypothetical protein HBNXNv_0131 [Candidatus Nanohalobia archaeon BNXNv]
MEGMKHRINSGKEDMEEAEKQVEEGLDLISEKLQKEIELYIDVCWTSQDFVVEEMGGSTGKAINPSWMQVKFNSKADNWKINLKSTTVHEYVHTWFFEKNSGRSKIMWKHIIEEALTQHFSKELVPEANHRKSTMFSREEIAEYWPQIKEKELEKKGTDFYKPLFINRSSSEYPNWLGYSLSYVIGQELLKKHTPEEFPELGKEDIIRVGDRIFLQ